MEHKMSYMVIMPISKQIQEHKEPGLKYDFTYIQRRAQKTKAWIRCNLIKEKYSKLKFCVLYPCFYRAIQLCNYLSTTIRNAQRLYFEDLENMEYDTTNPEDVFLLEREDYIANVFNTMQSIKKDTFGSFDVVIVIVDITVCPEVVLRSAEILGFDCEIPKIKEDDIIILSNSDKSLIHVTKDEIFSTKD